MSSSDNLLKQDHHQGYPALTSQWPRRSIAKKSFPFSHQPLKLLYQVGFFATFLPRLVLHLVPLTIYQQTLDKNLPPGRRWLETLSINLFRCLIDDLFLPTGGGDRGTHYTSLTDAQRLKLRKQTEALPELLQPDVTVDTLREPVQSWAKNAKVGPAKALTIWWLGRRSSTLVQEKAKEGEKIMVYISG
jgi:hypothetical protein